MVEAASEFRKNSFNDEDSAVLAKVATTFQNVADESMSAADSASFIIAQMKAFNIEAQNAESIIDAVNAVSNNYAVSSGQLAQNLGNMSAAMAVGNNTFEQSLGMLTAMTEITRNAAKGSRALITVQGRLNQVVDESSDTGKALTEWYEKHKIAVEDDEGQIRSLYDVLTNVAKIWPDLTKNEQMYYLQQQAGTTQTQNLAALLENFQTAVYATSTALNSAGSAMQENEKYMDSVEAKENQLKAEFEDFANRVLSKEVVTGFLDAGTAMLNFANNDVGAAITRIGAFAAVTGSAVGIIGSIIGKLIELSTTLKAMKAVEGSTFLSTLVAPKTLLIIAAVAGAIAGLIELGRYVNEKAYKAAHAFEIANEKLAETKTQIDETSQSLDTYKQRLEELNAVPLEERGAAWSNERAELDLNIQSAEAYLELLNTIAQSQAQELYSQDRVSGYSVKTSNIVGPQGRYTIQYRFSDEQRAAMEKQYNSEYEALVAVTSALADATDGQEAFISAEEMATLVGKSQEEQVELMTKMLANLHLVMDTTTETTEDAFGVMSNLGNVEGSLTQAQKELAQTYLDLYKNVILFNVATEEQSRAYVDLAAKMAGLNLDTATTAEKIIFIGNLFGMTANEAFTFAEKLGYVNSRSGAATNNVVTLSNGVLALKTNCEKGEDEVWKLKKSLDDMGDASVDASNNLTPIQSKVQEVANKAIEAANAVDTNTAAFARLVVQEIAFNRNDLNTSQKISALNNYLTSIGVTQAGLKNLMEMERDLGTSSGDIIGRLENQTKKAKSWSDVIREAYNQINQLDFTTRVTPSSTGGGGGSSSTTSTKSPAQLAAEAATKAAKYKLEAMQDELDALNDQKSALEDEIQKIEDDVKAEYQAEIDVINDKKDAIQAAYDSWKENADAALDILKAEKDAIQAVIDAIDKEKEQLEAAMAYATEYASRQIDEIDEQLDALDAKEAEINKKYDDELDKLKATNKELDKQIEREKLLQNLASAKNKKKRVYSAQQGYILVDDIAAISKAQAELDKFDRQQKQSLEEQEIENQRKQELLASGVEAERAALEEQKKLWEDYSKKWSSIVSDYEFKQNRLAYIQRTGKAMEQQTWQQRNRAVDQATKDYADIMARLVAEQERMAAKEAEIAAQEAVMDDARIANQKATAALEQQISDLQDQMVAAQEARARRQRQSLEELADAIEEAQRRVNQAQKEYDDAKDYEDSYEEEGRVLKQVGGKAPSNARVGDYIATAGGIWKITGGYSGNWRKHVVDGTEGQDFNDVDRARSWLIRHGYAVGYAKGTTNATPGLHMLGEKGPELGVLSRGDGVIPADITKNLMSIGKNPEKFASAAVAKTGGDIIMQGVTLAFPNVRDGSDASAFTKNFVNLAYQYAYKR